ncbi:MAG TPA: helix-turn-helix domain-containing protein [Deltaproteobacteria bacterium]|nr:helix-turn-helix domain-containing protein [Deltaproteobacteria bacterium]
MTNNLNSDKDNKSLQETRESLGLSIKDVFAQTRVSTQYLEAIENGDFHVLPEPIYAKNFIRTYARALGIDEKIILADYEDYLNSLNILEDVPPEDIPPQARFTEAISRHRTLLGIVSAVIVAFLIVWLVSMQYRPVPGITDRSSLEKSIAVASGEAGGSLDRQGREDTLSIAQTDGKEIEAAAGTAYPAKEISPVSVGAQNQEVAESEKSVLVIKATEETWLKIRIDKNPPFQVLLRPGQRVEYRAASFDMDIGNASGVVMQYNGRNIENLGGSGEVIRLRLP